MHALKDTAKRAIGATRRLRLQTVYRFPPRAEMQLECTTRVFGGIEPVDLAKRAFREAPTGFLNGLWRDHLEWGGRMEGTYDYFDMTILYFMVRHFGVSAVLECSPCKGWSTTVIQKALEGRPCAHVSFDIVDHEDRIRTDAGRHVELRGWTFVQGDVHQTLAARPALIPQADFLFIDSDHSGAFAQWYLEEMRLADQLKPGALIQIHDIFPFGGEPKDFGESPFVLHWLRANRERFDVFWTYEVSRLKPVMEWLPPRVFVNHRGAQANNCSLWLRKK